jgi:HAD superfamily hydrolase (TIGR01549 family)
MSRTVSDRLLCFDLDDTIVRFSAGQPDFWVSALAESLDVGHDAGLLRRAIDPVSDAFWSDPARAFHGRLHMHAARREIALAALTPLGVAHSCCLRIADHVTDKKEDHVRPFDGAIETLGELRAQGNRLALITNGSSAFQRRKIERFGLADLFELILVEGELGFGKPDPRVFVRALRHFGVPAQAAWMIGDNLDADIHAAQMQGFHAVWHDAYGTGLPVGARCVPNQVIRSVTEVPRLLETRSGS